MSLTKNDLQKLSDLLDTKLDAFRSEMNKRFESMDKRFESINKRFESMNNQFESIDKRFESIENQFEIIENQIESMGNQFKSIENQIVGLHKTTGSLRSDLNMHVVSLHERCDDIIGLIGYYFGECAKKKELETVKKRVKRLEMVVQA